MFHMADGGVQPQVVDDLEACAEEKRHRQRQALHRKARERGTYGLGEGPAHIGDRGGVLPLVVAHRQHQEGLAGRHVHLREEVPGKEERDSERCYGRQSHADQEHVGDQVGEDHGIDEPEPRRRTGRQQEREPREDLDAEEDPAERVEAKAEARVEPIGDQALKPPGGVGRR